MVRGIYAYQCIMMETIQCSRAKRLPMGMAKHIIYRELILMAQVERDKDFRANNVLSLRKKITQSEANQEMDKIARYLADEGIRQSGPIITATFNVDTEGEEPLMDMEILVPLDKKTDLPEEYRLKENFHIAYAVYAQHKGNPSSLHDTYNNLFTYLKENDLQQITAVYNAYVKGMSSGSPNNDLIIDVYVGVNPSTL